MDISDVMRQCLEELDVHRAQAVWGHIAPHLPQPQDDHDMLVCLHRARTEAASMPLDLRAYSHRWLLDRGWQSGLPDRLKPKAERLYPRVVSGVGIAVRSEYPEVTRSIRGAMEVTVLEAEADGKLLDSPFVKRRMMEARAKERRALFGRFAYAKES